MYLDVHKNDSSNMAEFTGRPPCAAFIMRNFRSLGLFTW